MEERSETKRTTTTDSTFSDYMAKPAVKEQEMEWQKIAREKASGEKIKEVIFRIWETDVKQKIAEPSIRYL